MATPSLYERVGGMATFERLVDTFYDGVEGDVLLRAMYPDDLVAPRRHLALFLAQYWGGPTTYGEERGHPRLRLRHAPFVIDEGARDAWLAHMRVAVDELALDEPERTELWDYLVMAASQLRNA